MREAHPVPQLRWSLSLARRTRFPTTCRISTKILSHTSPGRARGRRRRYRFAALYDATAEGDGQIVKFDAALGQLVGLTA